MAAFNLTAELNLRGPSNLNQVVSNIRRQLSTVSLDLRIDPRASSNIQGITSSVNTLSTALRDAQSSATSLNAALSNLGSTLNGAAGNINNLNNNLNNANNNINNVRNRTREATGEVEAFGRQAGLAVRRFAAFSLVAGTMYSLSRAISSAYGEFVNFNKEFIRLQQVTDQTAAGLKGLSQEITNLSQNFGVSSQSLLQVSVTLAQAGLSANDTAKALEALAKSALAPSFDNLNDTVEGSIALMRQFGIGAGDLESALGSINAVAAKFAVEAGDIIAAIQRTGGVFAAASKGVSEGKDALNEFISVFTSVRATTRESAETIATGLRTIFTRIQRGSTIQALKEYGVQLTDVEGRFVGAYEAVRRLSDGLSGLDSRDIRFSKIVEELGGFRQIGKVIPLIQQFSTAQQALGVAQRGAGSLAKDAATAQEGLAVKITKVREEFIALIRDIGQSKGFQTFVDISLKLASALISIADAAKGVLPALTAIVAIRGISNIGNFVSGFSQSVAGGGGGRRRRFASGGFVPGSGNGDTVPAMLTPGEFVIRKKAVQAIGTKKLAALNRSSGGYIPTQNFQNGGDVQKFAGGRFVMPKGRGSVGPRGARNKFRELSPEEIKKLSTQELLEYGRALARNIFTSGGAGIATSSQFIPVSKSKITPELEPYLQSHLGQRGFWREKISPFGRSQEAKVNKAQTKVSREASLQAQTSRMADEVAARAQQWTSIKSGSSIDNHLLSALKEPVLSDYKTSRAGGSLAKTFHSTRLRQQVNQALDSFDDFDYSPGNIDKLVSNFAAKRFNGGGKVQRFARGGLSRKLGVFDFDMTTGVSKQRETPSLSGFKDPRLAVPDILGASPTGLLELMKKYGASSVLTARSGGPRGEMRNALGSFFSKNGILVPSNQLITLGDQVGELGTAEKKARALHTMVKKYGSIDFFDDDIKNIEAAKMVRGVDARRVKVRKSLGGYIQKFSQPVPRPGSGRVKKVDLDDPERAIKQGMKQGSNEKYNFGLIALKSGTQAGARKEPFEIGNNKGIIHVGTLQNSANKKFSGDVEKNITKSLRRSIVETSKIIGSELKVKNYVNKIGDAKRILGGASLSSAVGSIFEASLQMLGAPYVDKIESIKSMDFPFGLGAELGPKFGIPGNAPTDATRTVGGSGKGISDFKGQIGRFLGAVEKKEFSKGLSKESLVAQRLINRGSFSSEESTKINSVLQKYSIMANVGRKMPKAAKDQLRRGLAGNKKAEDELRQLGFFAKGGTVRKFAKGGSAEDTVPALLTPGEFVINKKAASRLGSSKLNKLNRADKIQGFNSGGAVGDIQSFAGGGGVQRFFVGGLVRGMEGLVRVVTNLSTRMSTLGRNIPSGGGWTGGTRLGSMGVPDRSGDRMRNLIKDPMTLLFGAGIAGDTISKAGSPALGAAVAGGAGAAGIMATLAPLIGLTGPLGILATLLTGVTAGFFEYQSAQRQATIELNQSKSQSEAAILEQQFTILASKIKVTSESFDGIKTSLSNLQAYANTIRTTTIEEATPGTLARFAGINLEFFTAGFAGKNLGRMSPSQQASVSKQLESTARPVGEQTQRAVTEAMRRSRVGYDTAVNMVGGSRRDIAIAQGGSRVTDLEATLESVKVDRSLSPEVKKIRIEALETRIANTINYLNEEFKTLTESQIQNAKATNIASQVINQFGEGMKNLGSATSRASAEFDRSLTDIDIQIGTKLGGQVKAVSPSINENVFENLRAYSSGQVESTIRDMGGRLGFSQEFTQQAISSVQIQQSLEKGLSPIFARLAAKQASGTDEDTITTDLRKELTKLFKPLNLDPTTLGTILDQLTEQFATLAGQGADVTLSKLAESSVALQKVLGAHTQTTDGLNNTAKAYNSRQQELSSKLLEYSNALSRATEYQIEAASIRTQGRTQLKQALNKPVTLDELNKPFEDSVRTLTSGTSVRTGQRMAGTLDPAVIAARLQQTEDERNRLQQKQNTGQQLTQDEQLRLAQVNAQAANLEKALKSLSDNSSRASNALAKIQDLQKARQGRQDTFLDLLSNINNPEYLMDFVLNQQRYSAVMSGQNVGMQDLPGAVQALNTAMRGMSSEDQTRTLDRFIQQASASLGLDPATLRQLTLSLGGPEAEMNNAISRYNEAIEAQARANEEFAKRAINAGETLYNWIVNAGKEFARTVGGGAVVPKPEVVTAGNNATGGLIYASRGKYVNYEPKGTDTVPAMLTPGEFVINAKATKKNLSLLKAINSGNKGYSKGGLVYLQGGGFVSSVDEEIKQLQERIGVFDDETQNIIFQLSASTPETNPDLIQQLQDRIKSIRQVRNTEKIPLIEQLQRLVSTQTYEQNQNLVKEKFDAAKAAEEAENNIPLVLDQDSREAQKQAYIQQQEQKFAADQTRAKAQITQHEKYKEAFLDPNYRGPDAVRIAEQRKRAQESGFMARPLTPKEKVEKIKEQKRQEFLYRNPRLAQKEKEEKKQATRWWNSGGRFEDPNAPTDQFVPDDVVKRYNRLTAQQRATQIAEQQAADIAYQKRSGWPEERAFRNKETADNQRAQSGSNLYWSRLMLPDGTSYSDAKSEDIYRDLSKSSMPSGYRSLNSEQQKSADLAIEHWMREYEAKRSEGARESQEASKKAERESQKLERKAEIDLARRAVQAGVVNGEDIGVERVPLEGFPGLTLPSYSSTRPLTSEEKDKLAQEETKNRDRAVEDRRVLEKEALDRQAQDISRRKTEMIRRSDKDLGSRTRTNPYTGKPFENAGQEAGVTKRAAFENKSFTQIEAEREAGRTAVQTAVARRTKEEEERLAREASREAYAKEQTEYEERMRVASKKATEQRRYEQIRFERGEKNKGSLGYLAEGLYDTYGSTASAVAGSTPVKAAGQAGYGLLEIGYGLGVGTLGMWSALGTGVAGLGAKALENLNQQDLGQLLIHPKGRRKIPPVDPLARRRQPDIFGVKGVGDGLLDMTADLFVTGARAYQTALHGVSRFGAAASFDPEFMQEIGDSPLLKREKEQVEKYDTERKYVPILDTIAQTLSGGEYRFRQPTLKEIFRFRDEAIGVATPAPAIPGAGKLLSGVGNRVAGSVGRVAGALDQTIAQPVGRALQQKGIQQRVTDVVSSLRSYASMTYEGLNSMISTGTKRVSDVGQNLGARFRAVNDAMTIENAARIRDVRSGTTRVVNPTTGRVERIPDIFADNPEEYFKLFPEAEQRVFGKKFEYNNQLIREKTDAVIQRARDAEAANILEELDVSVAPRPTSEILPSATSQPLPNQIILTPEQKAAEAARLAQERLNTQKPLLQSLNEPTSIVYQNAPINSAAATEAAQRAAIKQSGRSSGSTTIPPKPPQPPQPQQKPRTRSELVEVQSMDPQAALRAQMEGRAVTRPQVSATRQKASGAASVTSETLPNRRIIKQLEASEYGPNLKAVAEAGNVHFGDIKQNPYGLTGWKGRLTPKDDASVMAIKEWLDTRGKELGVAQYKASEGGAFTFYSKSGAVQETGAVAQAAEKELMDKIQLGLFGEGDTFIPGTNISGRFDARDLGIDQARSLTEAQLKGSGFGAASYRKTLEKSRDPGSKFLPGETRATEGISNRGNAGVGGVHDSGYVTYLKDLRLKYGNTPISTTPDPAKLAKVEEEIARASQVGDEWFKKNFPDFYANGGIVYASKGTLVPYQPRGTDTVPAMLTPGEFVVNRKSAKENMGLLRAINTGKNVKPQRLNKGGLVNTQYYQEAGQVGSPSSSAGGVSSISLDTSSLDTAFGNFQTTVGNFATEIGKFDSSISKLNDIASALGSLGSIDLITPAADLKNSSVSVKDAVGLLQSQIGPFSSSVTTLASAISRIPQTIALTAQGSIPVNGTITVILEGSATGELDSTNSEKVQKSVFDKIALAINQATAGSLNIVQS